MKRFPLAVTFAFLATSGLVFGQGGNLVTNGGFEKATEGDSLWDGVKKDGTLAGFEFGVQVLTQGGQVRDTAMPISVDLGDLNGDGLIDIASADPIGYVRIFFNQGTPQEPKFGFGELSTPFVSRSTEFVSHHNPDKARRAPKISVSPLGGSPNSLLLGLYNGKLIGIRNSGGPTNPTYDQPTDLSRQVVETTEKPGEVWANLLSPDIVDWNKDGRHDLIVGEGSYSANNIHLLLNQATDGRPKFTEGNRYAVAFGDGKEQLTPAVADFNGDGNYDLVVGDREGNLSLYLSKPGPWEPGNEIPFASFISEKGGRTISFKGIVSVAAADMTADGLTDLIVGQSNGEIDFIQNVGSATEPEFKKVPLKGNKSTNMVADFSGWDFNFGKERGNFYGVVQKVGAGDIEGFEPAEGKTAVRIGYEKSPNQVIRPTYMALPGWEDFSTEDGRYTDAWHQGRNHDGYLAPAPSNLFKATYRLNGRLEQGKKYKFTAKVRGANASDVVAGVTYGHRKQISAGRLKQGGRDDAVVRQGQKHVTGTGYAMTNVSPGTSWREIEVSFTPKFEEDELEDIKQIEKAEVEFRGVLRPGEGEFFIDDVKLVPEG